MAQEDGFTWPPRGKPSKKGFQLSTRNWMANKRERRWTFQGEKQIHCQVLTKTHLQAGEGVAQPEVGIMLRDFFRRLSEERVG